MLESNPVRTAYRSREEGDFCGDSVWRLAIADMAFAVEPNQARACDACMEIIGVEGRGRVILGADQDSRREVDRAQL